MRIVTTSMSGPLAVSASRFVTPLSLRRLPKNSIPSRGIPEGTMNAVRMNPTIGKMIFSFWLTVLGVFMRMRRSFSVVIRSMIGRWMTGTRAIYEYADTAMAPMRCGASCDERKIAVGPSAPPMIPIAPDSAGVNPRCMATTYAPKIPICAAAPISMSLGCEISAEKSVIAPMPRKISGGYHPCWTP